MLLFTKIQIHIPPELIIEVPINIEQIDLNEKNIVLKPFESVQIDIENNNNSNEYYYGQPYKYTPKYPINIELNNKEIIQNNEELNYNKNESNDETKNNKELNNSLLKQQIIIINNSIEADNETKHIIENQPKISVSNKKDNQQNGLINYNSENELNQINSNNFDIQCDKNQIENGIYKYFLNGDEKLHKIFKLFPIPADFNALKQKLSIPFNSGFLITLKFNWVYSKEPKVSKFR